jgi:hypothetical protein
MMGSGYVNKKQLKRLKDIKFRRYVDVEIIPEDHDWLISEVERLQPKVERLQWEANYQHERKHINADMHTELEKKVERLEKTLKHIHVITQGDNYYNALLQIESVAKQALEAEGKE